MTFFQQTLGKNYKWWYILQYNFKSTSLSLKGNLINIVAETVRILAIIYVWYYKGSETDVFIYFWDRLSSPLVSSIFTIDSLN
jgi:hypothetical protein